MYKDVKGEPLPGRGLDAIASSCTLMEKMAVAWRFDLLQLLDL